MTEITGIDKKQMSEQDICTKFITPALINAGWNLVNQISEQKSFTSGEIILDDNGLYRKELKKYDYLLSVDPSTPLAIIEAKDNNHSIHDGMQQALDYADILDIPFVYSTNGDGFVEHDKTRNIGEIEKEISLSEFPSPEELYDRYVKWKGLTSTQQEVLSEPYYKDESGKKPRYYQRIAINKTIEAIIKGQNRILLVMATGSGKTYVASQIIWRLWKSKVKKRILFLADRNILVDQTMTNDFKHFKNNMTKITNRSIDKSYEIYLALYQGISGNEDYKNIYKEFSPDFFDLILIDECHRGSVEEDSNWREILEYYSSATQIGLTATPKETDTASNSEYFGEPIYTYSLAQGIKDGFLAPYKVINVDITAEDEKDVSTMEAYDKDIESKVVIDGRTQLVAKYVTNYLKNTDRFTKTIIFCEDTEHAARMRTAMVNENADLYSQNRKYIMRITGNDTVGKLELDNFIDPNEQYPVVVTTSKLLSTGVDAQTCELIVIDRSVKNVTTFKQMIGRGTRINEEHNKYFFTIIDFRNATDLFYDENFDGNPIQKERTTVTKEPDSSMTKPKVNKGKIIHTNTRVEKTLVDGVNLKINAEEVKYFDGSGKLITSDFKDYFVNNVLNMYGDVTTLKNNWINKFTREQLVKQVFQDSTVLDRLLAEYGQDYDPYNIIIHIVFNEKLFTKKNLIEKVLDSSWMSKFDRDIQYFLIELLEKYRLSGINNLDDINVLKLSPFNEKGTILEIINKFGGKDKYFNIIEELKAELYQ